MTEIDTGEYTDENTNASQKHSLEFQNDLIDKQEDSNPIESDQNENNTDRKSSPSAKKSLKHAEVEKEEEETEEVHEVELTVTLTACFPLGKIYIFIQILISLPILF